MPVKDLKMISFIILSAFILALISLVVNPPGCGKTLSKHADTDSESAISFGIYSATEAEISIIAPCGGMDPVKEPAEWLHTKKTYIRPLHDPPDGTYIITISGDAGSYLVIVVYANMSFAPQTVQKKIELSDSGEISFVVELRNGSLTAK